MATATQAVSLGQQTYVWEQSRAKESPLKSQIERKRQLLMKPRVLEQLVMTPKDG